MNARTMSAAVAGALVVLLAGCSGGGSEPDRTDPDKKLSPLGEYDDRVCVDQDAWVARTERTADAPR